MTKDEQWLLDEKYGGTRSAEFEADRERLAAGEPLAYVIGWQPFLGLKIHLDSRPLIPRPETEWWVEQMLKTWTSDVQVSFLDLCAGSGAIGCAALKTLPYMEVSFGEIDPAHEATILKNIRENNLDESRATIRIGDLFDPYADERFDLIAVNPPYIPADRVLPPSVARYEPARALYAGADGLEFIRRIAYALRRHLALHGTAWIEVDSAHAPAAHSLFVEQGFAPEILADQYGQPRVIRI